MQSIPDISTLPCLGHFYFALTGKKLELPEQDGHVLLTLAEKMAKGATPRACHRTRGTKKVTKEQGFE